MSNADITNSVVVFLERVVRPESESVSDIDDIVVTQQIESVVVESNESPRTTSMSRPYKPSFLGFSR